MIPTAILVGLLLGRWWLLPLIGVGWVLLLADQEVCTGLCWGASGLAVANGAFGILLHKGIASSARRIRARFFQGKNSVDGSDEAATEK